MFISSFIGYACVAAYTWLSVLGLAGRLRRKAGIVEDAFAIAALIVARRFPSRRFAKSATIPNALPAPHRPAGHSNNPSSLLNRSRLRPPRQQKECQPQQHPHAPPRTPPTRTRANPSPAPSRHAL
ncbi:uncharacterized protein EV422DRAFT_329559 [Fimicolochytrium jonesii]|uniref:uncharacterized protein n=1 Tax=Fimicolochytrium jonesii TaxID=1396493 RepID=UPI0022FDFA43|nr:uncharacterized protein EV422DRAFT_329559 [Fimicolochytrium jonesii]KAI8816181.1 hypothetical protein EV422DRAFT_329559 [Fimicolochytrium jonesii]